MHIRLLLLVTSFAMISSCKNHDGAGTGAGDSGTAASGVPSEGPLGQFGYDLKWIGRFDRYRIVLQSGRSKVLVSPKFQGKVFSSCADGDSSESFGWVHYYAFQRPVAPHINTDS